MKVNRLARVRVVSIAILALLFAQLSVAAYACPALAPPQAEAEMGTDCAGMPNPMGHDEAAPNLCAEHCHYGQQTDQARTPSVPAVSLVSLYVVPLIWTSLASTQPELMSPSLLAARPPPHTILHCCFRI